MVTSDSAGLTQILNKSTTVKILKKQRPIYLGTLDDYFYIDNHLKLIIPNSTKFHLSEPQYFSDHVL